MQKADSVLKTTLAIRSHRMTEKKRKINIKTWG